MNEFRSLRGSKGEKRTFILTLVLRMVFLSLIFTVSANAQERTQPATSKPTAAEREVRVAIDTWADAVKRRDVDALNLLFADDLFITDFTGATRGKKEEIEVLKSSPATSTVSVENEEIRIRTFPKANTAVVTAIVRMVFRTNDRDTPMAMR